MNEKIGRYTEDEILEHLTKGEGRGFLGRSMYDAIFDKIHALKTENEQTKKENARLKDKNKDLEEWLEAMASMYENEYKDVDASEHYKCMLHKLKEN